MPTEVRQPTREHIANMKEDEISTGPSLWELTKTFLHLGATAYGGLAMVEPIRRQVVQERGWLSQQDFLDGLALCQLLPGATVVQLAAYVGYHLRRTTGALAAAGAFILPALVLMCGLSALYLEYGELTWVKALSRGFNAVVIALLLQALWRFKEIIRRHWLDPVIALLTLGALWGGANYLLVFLAAGFLRWALGLRWAPEADGLGAVASPERLSQPGRRATRALAAALALALVVWGLWRLDQQLGLMALIFLKVGVLAFGGGYAMIPILQWEMVDHLGWLSLRQFLDGILLGFITPGPIIITATFIGFWIKGLAGALVGTVAIFLPPILMIIFLTPLYQRLKEWRGMRLAIQGILSTLVGMLVLVTLQLGRASLVDLPSWAIMVGAAVALIALRINLAWVVVTAAGLSLVIF